jgi:hypothetical protein
MSIPQLFFGQAEDDGVLACGEGYADAGSTYAAIIRSNPAAPDDTEERIWPAVHLTLSHRTPLAAGTPGADTVLMTVRAIVDDEQVAESTFTLTLTPISDPEDPPARVRRTYEVPLSIRRDQLPTGGGVARQRRGRGRGASGMGAHGGDAGGGLAAPMRHADKSRFNCVQFTVRTDEHPITKATLVNQQFDGLRRRPILCRNSVPNLPRPPRRSCGALCGLIHTRHRSTSRTCSTYRSRLRILPRAAGCTIVRCGMRRRESSRSTSLPNATTTAPVRLAS